MTSPQETSSIDLYKIGQTLIYATTVPVNVVEINGGKYFVSKISDGQTWETTDEFLDDDLVSFELREKYSRARH